MASTRQQEHRRGESVGRRELGPCSADQGCRKFGNHCMTGALLPAPSVAACRSGQGRTAMTLVMATEARAQHRDAERDK